MFPARYHHHRRRRRLLHFTTCERREEGHAGGPWREMENLHGCFILECPPGKDFLFLLLLLCFRRGGRGFLLHRASKPIYAPSHERRWKKIVVYKGRLGSDPRWDRVLPWSCGGWGTEPRVAEGGGTGRTGEIVGRRIVVVMGWRRAALVEEVHHLVVDHHHHHYHYRSPRLWSALNAVPKGD